MSYEKDRGKPQEFNLVSIRPIFDFGFVVVITSEEDHPADLEDKLHCIIRYSSGLFETEEEARDHARDMIKLTKAGVPEFLAL